MLRSGGNIAGALVSCCARAVQGASASAPALGACCATGPRACPHTYPTCSGLRSLLTASSSAGVPPACGGRTAPCRGCLRCAALPSAAFSTTGSAAASSPQRNIQEPRTAAQTTVLTPGSDIPSAARAPLADDLGPSGSRRSLGRASSRPRPAVGTTAAQSAVNLGAPGAEAVEGPADESEERETRAVFDKIIGGLTKSGKKGPARRIVLDAMRVIQEKVRKGGLEELK